MLVGLALLTVFSVAVRLCGIGYLLPLAFIGDGSVPVTQVELLRAGGDPARATGDALYYPYLLAHLVALIPEEGPGDGVARNLDEHRSVAAAPWRNVRLVSALLSILALPGTWLLTRRFLGDGWALLAAAFFATSLMHADFSSQDRPHGVITTFVLFAVLAALRLRQRADVSSYLFAGLTAGLAIGTLQSGLAVLPAFLAAIVLQERAPGRASRWWALASLVIVALFVRWLYPFHFTPDVENVTLGAEGVESAVNLTGHVIFLEGFDGTGFRRILTSLLFWDPILLFACVTGLGFFARRLAQKRRPIEAGLHKDLLVIAAYALPYLLVLGAYTYMLERFLMPLLPMFAGLAAYGTRRLLETIGRLVPLPARALPVLAACLPALAALPILQLARVHGAVDTYELAARAVRANVVPGERIVVVPFVEMPLFQDENALDANSISAKFSHWVRYQRRMQPEEFTAPRFNVLMMPPERIEAYQALERDPLAYFAAQEARYVLLGTAVETHVVFNRVRDALASHAQLMLRASPERVDSGRSTILVALHDDEGPAVQSKFRRPYGLTLFRFGRMGPTIELYRLEPGN